jgi:hypothetical protein
MNCALIYCKDVAASHEVSCLLSHEDFQVELNDYETMPYVVVLLKQGESFFYDKDVGLSFINQYGKTPIDKSLLSHQMTVIG